MIDDNDIAEQKKLLQTYRHTLSHYLHQRAMLGAANIPPGIAHGIFEARNNIRRIKKVLCDWGISVDDHPNDEEIVEPNQEQRPPDLPQDASTWPFIDTGFALHAIHAGNIVSTFRLERLRMIVGRSSIADVNLSWERFASRSHFAIIWESNTTQHFVEDWGHPNHITINGKWVQSHAKIELKEGDEIRLGETILRYVLLEVNRSEE